MLCRLDDVGSIVMPRIRVKQRFKLARAKARVLHAALTYLDAPNQLHKDRE
jgi:hypothetical protein